MTTTSVRNTVGFKGFKTEDSKMQLKIFCRHQEYTVGETVTVPGPIELCASGIHYCLDLFKVFKYYPPNDNIIYGAVTDLGDLSDHDEEKSCTNVLRLDCILDGKIVTPKGEAIFKAGRLHCEDGPAVIHAGLKSWYLNGKLQYQEFNNGSFIKYKNGIIHCDDGPAVVMWWGTEMWYRDGKLHCETGPAVRNPDGINYNYIDGILMVGDRVPHSPLPPAANIV